MRCSTKPNASSWITSHCWRRKTCLRSIIESGRVRRCRGIMKLLVIAAFGIGLFAHQAFGQGAQADQIKRRAKELSNQNNVRQGVPAPSPAKPAAAPGDTPAAAKAATPAPVASAQQGIAKLQADIAGI